MALTFQCTGSLSVPVVEVELLYVPGCPNRLLARSHVEDALAATGLAAVIREQVISTGEEAARAGMRGSPTILIDGWDPFGPGTTGDPLPSLACRLYHGDAGLTGAPTVEQLIDALSR